MKRTRRLLSLITWLALVGALAQAQENQQKNEQFAKNHYQNIEVADFDVKEGVKLPPDYIKPMMDEIVSRLGDMKKFKRVLRPSDTPADSAAPSLKLTGTVTEFKAGSRTKRYLGGFGAGKTRVITQIKFIDKTTGAVLYAGEASGGVSWGNVRRRFEGSCNRRRKADRRYREEEILLKDRRT
jgi:hypothetical protein